MRKPTLLLFLLIVTVLFSGCSDDEDEKPSTASMLAGTWEITSTRTQYYDDQDNKMGENLNPHNNGNTYRFEGSIRTYSRVKDNSNTNTHFSIQRKGGKEYIVVKPSGSYIEEYEIVKLTKDELVWQLEGGGGYFTINDRQQLASRALYIVELKKK